MRQCERGIINWLTDLAPKISKCQRSASFCCFFLYYMFLSTLYTSRLTEIGGKTVIFFDGWSIWLTELITESMNTRVSHSALRPPACSLGVTARTPSRSVLLSSDSVAVKLLNILDSVNILVQLYQEIFLKLRLWLWCGMGFGCGLFWFFSAWKIM